MTENDFRVKYCELMEYYQYLEMRLKFICAALLADEEKGWFGRAEYGNLLISDLNDIPKSLRYLECHIA